MHISIQPEVLLKILVCTLIGFVIFFMFSITQFFSYMKVDAIITDIHTNSYESITTESNSVKTYSIKYLYSVGGITYESTYQTFIKPRKQIGEFTTIRCNPNNPQILFSCDKFIIVTIGIIFLILFILATRKGMHK